MLLLFGSLEDGRRAPGRGSSNPGILCCLLLPEANCVHLHLRDEKSPACHVKTANSACKDGACIAVPEV